MRIGWIGVHAEGISALESVCAAEYNVVGMLTLRQEKADRRCGSADYYRICDQYRIPLHEVDHINDESSLELLRSWNSDLLVVLGWGQILSPEALQTARIGAVGAHASLLPHNRGSAPVNWAIINGETSTGNSLLWLASGIDTGEIIDQRAFPITPYDTCATIYDHVAESNRDMMLDLCFRLQGGERPGRPQIHSGEPMLPRRRPQDGLIPWDTETERICNMVRALTRPYPGASAVLGGQTYQIWRVAGLPVGVASAQPGTLLGPIHSPDPRACGQLVATADGAVVLLEIEAPDGTVLHGRDLCEFAPHVTERKHAA